MQTSVDDCGTLRKQVTISYDAQEVAARADELLGRYGTQATIKGFRPGKAPRAVLKARYGKAAEGEARSALIDEGFKQLIKDQALEPFGQVEEQDIDTKDGVRAVLAFDIRPTVNLPEIDSLTITTNDTSASPEEVEEEITQLCRRMGTYVDLDDQTTLVSDDVIVITGTITSNGETVRSIEDLRHIVGAYPLFGTGVDEVVAMVADKKVGDVLEFTTTLPENFQPEQWGGKEVQVSVTIQQGQRLEPATLDDDLATRIGAESVDNLRERITMALAARKENALVEQQNTEIIDQLIERCPFELPPHSFDKIIEQGLAAAMERHQDADPERRQELEQEERERIVKDTTQALRRHLILDAVANQYDVHTTRQDLEQQISMAAYQSGRKPAEIAQELQESGRLNEVAHDIREHKALELIRRKLTETPATEEADASS